MIRAMIPCHCSMCARYTGSSYTGGYRLHARYRPLPYTGRAAPLGSQDQLLDSFCLDPYLCPITMIKSDALGLKKFITADCILS